MRIVVAPDSYKGSLQAKEIGMAIQTGINKVLPDAEVITLPLADGGEGTMENLIMASGGTKHFVWVTDPRGEEREVAYGVMGDGKTAVIELAQASGLPLVPLSERNPMKTTSYGTGELILHALDMGYRKFIIGLGGSATMDGGIGLLQALGMQFYDEDGGEVPANGEGLIHLKKYDETRLDARLKESSFVIASDVTNPLCGVNGAAAVFGPQKGASPEMVELFDQALHNFSEIVRRKTGAGMEAIEGGGAAGGIGSSMVAFLGAELKSGIAAIMKETEFEQKVRRADLIFTGEGKLDDQTFSGKVINGVCDVAKKYNVPVIALCGSIDISMDKVRQMGILSAFSIVPGPCSLEEALINTPDWITDRTEAIMRLSNYFLHTNKDNEKMERKTHET